MQDADDLIEINPLDLFCSSLDTLRGTSIDQIIPPNSGWSSRPNAGSGVAGLPSTAAQTTNNLLAGITGGSGAYRTDRDEIQRMCRRGIPPSLKCAAWIINVVAAANPSMSKSDCDDFGTFRKVRVIDHGWDLTLKSLFPDESDLERAEVIDFGVGHDHLMNIMLRDHGGRPIPDKGIQSLTKVLHAARDSLGLEFCPLLPDVSCLLLSYMPESYAYATIRQMVVDDSSYFLAISRVQHLAWCKTFSDLMKRCFPQTAAVMEQIGALKPSGLEPILKRFLIPLLRRKHVLRVMDIYTGEGAHALFRIGTTLCCLAHAHLGDTIRECCDNVALFWEGVRRFAHSKHFRFDIFLHQAYGVQKSFRILTRPIFPRHDFVARLISNNEAWAEENQSNLPIHEDKKALGLREGRVPIVLAKHSPERLCLAEWLPPSLQSTRLELIYSSNHHGRSIEMFYRCCSSAIHTVTIMEVLGTDKVVGMYASQTWHNNPDGYGDGGCFLFRLNPNPECFKYKVGASRVGSFDNEELENISRLDDAGQLMISSGTFVSMGVGEGGASGLRLNEDLTRGSTSKSIGFDNEELIAEGQEVFEVGLVEVYRFIREVDNKPVDKVDPWRGMFD
mmetsp:Transcript_33082/g.69465  ORF Transcript_33082/g.69465 Transcript_33082/m.69465 type:complete len:617 (-) Transcript_33082:84-1934(-)